MEVKNNDELKLKLDKDEVETPVEDTETPVEDVKIEFKKVEAPKSGGKLYKAFKGRNGKFYTIMLAMLLTAPVILQGFYLAGLPKIEKFKPEHKVDYKGTEIGVTMSKEDLTLDFEVDNAVVKLDNGKYIELSSDILHNILNTDLNIVNDKFTDNGLEYSIGADLKITSFDNYNDMMYIVYKNKEFTGMREVLVSKDLLDGLAIDGMQSINNGIYESNTETSVAAFTRTFENSVVYHSDQLLGGELGTKTLVSRVQAIKDGMRYSTLETGVTEEVVVKFDESIDLKLSELSSLQSAPGVYFSEDDGVLRLYNYKDDIPYIFVSHLNNQLFFCNADDLLETNYLNLYVTRGFDDSTSAGYRTFAITTDNNVYAFRVSSEAPDQLLSELLDKFGYNRDNLTIKPVQEMVPTEAVEESLNEQALQTIEDVESEDVTLEVENTDLEVEENNE